MYLHDTLRTRVSEWRNNSYNTGYSVIGEILNFNYNSGTQNLRFLRKAQFDALETYWYLRLIEKTPHIFDLYKKIFPPNDLLDALGIKLTDEDWKKIAISGGGINSIFKKIRDDDAFVKKYRLQALRETLILSYSSYILALAMGAGKTILIGAIIATEFAMALEYPEDYFVKNALVFAPGKTILGALKELSDVPYEKILPERLYKQFITTTKFTYTRDGEKDIPIIKGSSYNIVVTNTEKIRIQKQSITKSLIKDLFVDPSREDEVKEVIANQRLQTIASLPNLAIFSDEAHHTYGLALGKELKRVRQTVNYLSEETNVLVVVNTTGTPYYKRQILKDVVCWYGLSQGIKDGILKEVRGNIVSYSEVTDRDFLKDVITDFFKSYKDVKIYDGSPSKLAIYFPKIEDLTNAKPVVEKTLIELGFDPSIVLEVHNESKQEVKDLFDNRINDPHLLYRIFLLVNKGTEGWNCLSLFSTALARKLTASNNFCLQAASRCLRQTTGNIHKAKIYLSKDNVGILDTQLKETYGETLEDLNRTPQDIRKDRLILRKVEIPPVLLRKKIQKVIPVDKEIDITQIELQKPDISIDEVKKIFYDLKEIPDRKGVLIAQKDEKLITEEDFVDAYSFAVELSALYRLPLMPVHEKLKNLYPDGEMSSNDTHEIKKQIERQLKNYKIIEEEVESALALVKTAGFNKKDENYVTEIIYHKDKEHLLKRYEEFKELNKRDFGFHYNPYKFDSNPEVDFFQQLLAMLNENPADVEDVYFTGAIDDPKKTDFLFEYKGKDGGYHNYSPDFLIRRKNGKMLIIEIKAERFKDEAKEKEMRRIEGLNPDRLKYEIVETKGEQLTFEGLNKVREAIYKYGGYNGRK
ncbi:DEAD/DEAH box helicase family protein [candidate division WOR-3 bacterium]|nr:DEAD/DEAH box helicase family protein [candidate division WOR-3 bacterium]MCK4328718.1 DEAD/DEAH box helicase family protein [candidate division WOR-3 bacterium]